MGSSLKIGLEEPIMEIDLNELEQEEKKFVETLQDIRKRLMKLSLWLVILYACVFIMLAMSVIDGINGSYVWMVVYALLGILNLHNTSNFHKMKREMSELEYQTLIVLFIINKKKESMKESC
ncbi:hypothetical protein [Halobacillus sp. H74]|uniref:hypothetical protein n=1 Tax=Halobacillus sp. H74 TaxID=3457436 RepID=UPI003FCDB326